MADAIYYSAQNHYSGDIIIAGFEKEINADQHIYAETIPLLRQKIEESDIEPDKIVLRTLENSADNTIYYNGTAVPLKYVVGVDWDAEIDYFNSSVTFMDARFNLLSPRQALSLPPYPPDRSTRVCLKQTPLQKKAARRTPKNLSSKHRRPKARR